MAARPFSACTCRRCYFHCEILPGFGLIYFGGRKRWTVEKLNLRENKNTRHGNILSYTSSLRRINHKLCLCAYKPSVVYGSNRMASMTRMGNVCPKLPSQAWILSSLQMNPNVNVGPSTMSQWPSSNSRAWGWARMHLIPKSRVRVQEVWVRGHYLQRDLAHLNSQASCNSQLQESRRGWSFQVERDRRICWRSLTRVSMVSDFYSSLIRLECGGWAAIGDSTCTGLLEPVIGSWTFCNGDGGYFKFGSASQLGERSWQAPPRRDEFITEADWVARSVLG